LKYMYGNRLPDLPRSRSACLFFKDGAFLVWFGALAVGMAHSWEKAANPADKFAHFPDGLDSFFAHAELFLTPGFASPLAAVRILAPVYVVLLYVDFEHSVRTLRG